MERFVEIDGGKIHVYEVGQGKPTIVLFSGSGVLFPGFEYYKLAKTLAKTFRVVGIEKFGYGFSDLSEGRRTVDDIVGEYHAVLQALEIPMPVVLAAHSMGFLEALRFGQRYPAEVCGILGIDPATPECYQDFDVEGATKGLIALSEDERLRKTTAGALVQLLAEEHGLPAKEKQKLLELAFCRLANKCWIREAEGLRAALALVEENNPYLQTPMCFFVSNGEGTTLAREVWTGHARRYLEHIKTAHCEFYDLPHNLYREADQKMATEAEAFFVEHLEKSE